MEIVNAKKKNKRKLKVIILLVMLVIINMFIIFSFFNNKINPKIVEISEQEIKKITYSYILDYTDYEYLNKDYFDEIIKITQNNNKEIMYVDFNLDPAYIFLDKLTKKMQNGLKNLSSGNIDNNYYDYYLKTNNNGVFLNIPIGLISNNPFFSNLGPKIPVKVVFVDTLVTNLKTKITNYGLNNALIELYAYVWVTEKIITPFSSKEIKVEYDCLIAAKMINGRVPSIYGDIMQSDSSLINIPLN